MVHQLNMAGCWLTTRACVDRATLTLARVAESPDAAAVGVRPLIYTPAREWASRAEYRTYRAACRAAPLLICTHAAALIDVIADGLLLGLPAPQAQCIAAKDH